MNTLHRLVDKVSAMVACIPGFIIVFSSPMALFCFGMWLIVQQHALIAGGIVLLLATMTTVAIWSKLVRGHFRDDDD